NSLFYSQENRFVYKEIADNILDKKVLFVNIEQTLFDIGTLLTESNSQDPSVNTEIIQSAINKYKKVKLPNLEIVLSSKGLNVPSNALIFFDTNSVLRIEENVFDRYELLRVHNVENVSIYNARLIGDRGAIKMKKGEWGHGISIRGSKNVIIKGFTIREFYGDGIYVGFEEKGVSDSVTIKDGIVDYNRRNGISITSAKNVLIDNVILSNTYGTNPNFGLDIEPNNVKDEIDKIFLSNILSYNNNVGGIMITLSKMLRGDVLKETNIEVVNFIDEGSIYEGFIFAKIIASGQLLGNLNVNNISVSNNFRPIIIGKNEQEKFKIKVSNYNIKNSINKNFDVKEFRRINKGKKNIIIE
ncbi:right-handed parallel beta-helix repeat-containing protein, partial [Myroides odoratimimus]